MKRIRYALLLSLAGCGPIPDKDRDPGGCSDLTKVCVRWHEERRDVVDKDGKVTPRVVRVCDEWSQPGLTPSCVETPAK